MYKNFAKHQSMVECRLVWNCLSCYLSVEKDGTKAQVTAWKSIPSSALSFMSRFNYVILAKSLGIVYQKHHMRNYTHGEKDNEILLFLLLHVAF